MAIEITNIDVFVTADDEVFDFHLEDPRLPFTVNSYNVRFLCWLHSKQYPVASLSFECEGRIILEVPAFNRKDIPIAKENRENSKAFGIEATVPLAGLPDRFKLHIVAHLGPDAPEAQRWLCIAALDGKRSRFVKAYNPRLKPLLMTSGGRVGSSLMMSFLNAHPQIITHGCFPYEMKSFLYWMRVAIILSTSANHIHSSKQWGFEHEPYSIGFHPFIDVISLPPSTRRETRDWIHKEYFSNVIDFFVQQIDEFYSRISLDQNKPQAVYFAEKASSGDLQDFCYEVYPDMKEIMLVRDFRDMYTSIRTFNNRRGKRVFGRERAQTDFEHVTLLAQDASHWAERYEQHKDKILLVKYEALISSSERELKRIFNFLEISSDKRAITDVINSGQEKTNKKVHITSGTALKSIGRWATDLPPDLAKHCNREFKIALKTFGYI